MARLEDEECLLVQRTAKILNETRTSNATHIRKLKELSYLRSSSSSPSFFIVFSRALLPLFNFRRRTASAERVVRFVSSFATRDYESDDFLGQFIRFLLVATNAANKSARFRSCQIISEIIMRLPDDADVSDELWDEVIECMKLRVGDKVPLVRTFAIRALSRFASDPENSDIMDLFLEALSMEQNSEVRKAIILSMPPSNTTLTSIVDCTMDVSESVRKAAYSVLGNKFPLQSLSIKLRTIVLHRGLADRSPAVAKECLKLLKDEWLVKCCKGDLMELLKYLDVETYESVGCSVTKALLEAGLVKVHSEESIKRFIVPTQSAPEGSAGTSIPNIELIEAEAALYWRIVCGHLQIEAQAKGSDAAATTGTEAAVYAAEASDRNDLLEKVLPATVSDYVHLVKAHLAAGSNYHFTCRQLLLLGAILDFSDSTNRKVGSGLVQELLHRPIEYEVDEAGNKVVIGDGISLGGDREWADAVSVLAMKVHAAPGEFEEVIIGVVGELAMPCRERTADFMQWMHCLAVAGLLLENAKSIRLLQGKSIEPAQLLQFLLLPGAKHVHLDVQRVAVRCLGLLGLLDRKPNEELVKQLKFSFIKGSPAVSIMACKALFDLSMWHGPEEVDRALGCDLSSGLEDNKIGFNPVNVFGAEEDPCVEVLDLLFAGFDVKDGSSENDENESVHAVLGEGFAKFLLLGENYPSISTSAHPFLLAKLVNLYFNKDTNDLLRLKQCLSVFFQHYPSLSANHKKNLSKAFIPVMRSMWPGISGINGGSPVEVSRLRKRAIQASRFMLQMMHTPLYGKAFRDGNEIDDGESPETTDGPSQSSVDCGEEELALQISAQVLNLPIKKSPAEKSYVSALCKILPCLRFRPTEQAAVKLMRRLLPRVVESVSADKELVKDLKQMANRLASIDKCPDTNLQDQINDLSRKLELDINLDADALPAVPPTPAPCSSRPARSRRRMARRETSSDEECSPASAVPDVPSTTRTVSQRASKTAALCKMTANKAPRIVEIDDEGELLEESDVTSEDELDESDESAECG